MSSLKSPVMTGEVTNVTSPAIVKEGDIVKTGNLKKLKSMKKKYFVLRAETPEALARLEYYDSEKKFLANNPPKRSISLKTCFNINRRTDLKPKYVIALYTKDDCFCIVLENEQECESWLRSLLTLQHGEEILEGQQPKPDYEHVWRVTVQNKGIGHQCNIVGRYRLCLSLSTRTVSLVRLNRDGEKDSKDFSLNYVRTCGAAQSFFYMEVGRQAVTGPGAIWMLADDDVIASDINRIMTSAMGNGTKEETAQRSITRSQSVSEATKPSTIPSRRQTHSGTPKSSNNIDDKHSSRTPGNQEGTGSVSNIDLYCEMQHQPGGGLTLDQTDGYSLSAAPKFLSMQHQALPQFANLLDRPEQRRHSVSAVTISTSVHHKGLQATTNSPSFAPAPTPTSAHHHQRTYSFPLSPLPPSTTVRRASIGAKCGLRPANTVVHVGGGDSGGCVGGGAVHSTASTVWENPSMLYNPFKMLHDSLHPLMVDHCSYSSSARERCDSLPSSTPRPGVVNDNSQYQHGIHHPVTRNVHHSHPVPSHGHRPHSMYSRAYSHSPPVVSSPASPSSGACSTDSAGSSLSIDEGDGIAWSDSCDGLPLCRYGTGTGHSMLTPEEPIILEENSDDYAHWNGPILTDSSVSEDDKMNNYVPMDRSPASLSLPIQSLTIGGSNPRKLSGGSSHGGGVGSVVGSRTGSSPSHPSYMDMCSPCSSSPMDSSSSYALMTGFGHRNVSSHQTHTAPSSANHSRTSSLAEETPDGYVPMVSGLIDDGYVDMEPTKSGSHEDFRRCGASPSSQGSLVSGTPSTDLRFSEYQMEKGNNSYFEEDSGANDRPTRCYSVGSKPEGLRKKSRLEVLNQPDCRVRALSLGSGKAPGSKFLASRPLAHDLHARHAPGGHFTPPSHHRVHQPTTSKKSSSAPLLSNSWSGSPMNRHLLSGSHSSVEPMDDLMEMDFSHNAFNKSVRKSLAKSRTKTISTATACDPALSERERISSTTGANVHTTQSSADGCYMEMNPSRTGVVSGSPRALSDLRTSEGSSGAGSPPKVTSSIRNAFNNVIGIGRSPPESMARSPPGRTGSSPRSAVTRMSSITELKPQNFPSTTPSPPIKQTLLNTTSSSNMKMKMGNLPYVEMRGSEVVKPVTSAYVEMKPRPVNASSAPTRGVQSPSNQEYVDMNFTKQRKMSLNEVKENHPVVRRTAPVDTPMVRKTTEGYVEMSWNQSKKWSLDSYRQDGTAKNKSDEYMNMSCGNSTKSRKEHRTSRKDSSRNSTSTDSGSVGSPDDLADHNPLRARKSSRDSTSSGGSSMTPTGSNSTIFPLSPGSPLKSFPASAPDESPSANSYVEMTPGRGLKSPSPLPTSPADSTGHDYVNFCPGSTPSDKAHSDDECPRSKDPLTSPTEEPARKISAPVESTYSKLSSYRPGSNDLGLKRSAPTLNSFKASRPSSQPLTISSLLGFNNLNTATPKPSSAKLSPSSTLPTETKILNRETETTVPSVHPAGSGDRTASADCTDEAPGTAAEPSETPPGTAPLATMSPGWSPSSSPSPVLAETSSGKGSPCKKMSSGSDSSSTSRDSQQPSPAGKGKGKGKGEANRRLSCPNKMNVSRQGSASSEASELSSQCEEAANKNGGAPSGTPSGAPSRQTSTATLDKRSFSCSPELLGNPADDANPPAAATGSASPVAVVEKELNYASLDLRSGSESEDLATKSPRLAEAHSASPNPADGSGSTPSFTYVEIDFVKSEELRRANSASKAGSTTATPGAAVSTDAEHKSGVKRRV